MVEDLESIGPLVGQRRLVVCPSSHFFFVAAASRLSLAVFFPQNFAGKDPSHIFFLWLTCRGIRRYAAVTLVMVDESMKRNLVPYCNACFSISLLSFSCFGIGCSPHE